MVSVNSLVKWATVILKPKLQNISCRSLVGLRDDSSLRTEICICRILRTFTVVYNTQNYWVSGLCPLSGILLCYVRYPMR
jgi:hypothetical protein